MLTLDQAGIPGIVCGKCRESIPVCLAMVLKFKDLSVIQLVCLDCAEKLQPKHPGADFIAARDYFEAILAPGRPKRLLPHR